MPQKKIEIHGKLYLSSQAITPQTHASQIPAVLTIFSRKKKVHNYSLYTLSTFVDEKPVTLDSVRAPRLRLIMDNRSTANVDRYFMS